jgi:hypothetical protein
MKSDIELFLREENDTLHGRLDRAIDHVNNVYQITESSAREATDTFVDKFPAIISQTKQEVRNFYDHK